MEYNKRNFKKADDKKVLHKVRKHWVVVSMALLMAIGGKAALTHVNASANDVNDNNPNNQMNHGDSQVRAVLNQNNGSNQANRGVTNRIQNQSLNPAHITAQANALHQQIISKAGRQLGQSGQTSTLNNASQHGNNLNNNLNNVKTGSNSLTNAQIVNELDNSPKNTHRAKKAFNQLPSDHQNQTALKQIYTDLHKKNVVATHFARRILGSAYKYSLNNGSDSDAFQLDVRFWGVPSDNGINHPTLLGDLPQSDNVSDAARNNPKFVAHEIRGWEADPYIRTEYKNDYYSFDPNVKGTHHGLLFDMAYNKNAFDEPIPSSFPAGLHTLDIFYTAPKRSRILIEYDDMSKNGQPITKSERTDADFAGAKLSLGNLRLPSDYYFVGYGNQVPSTYPVENDDKPYIIHIDVKPDKGVASATINYIDKKTGQSVGTAPINGTSGDKIPSDVYINNLNHIPNGNDYKYIGVNPGNSKTYANGETLEAYVSKGQVIPQPITVFYITNSDHSDVIGKPYTIKGDIGSTGNVLNGNDPIPDGYSLANPNSDVSYRITSDVQPPIYVNLTANQENPNLQVTIYKENTNGKIIGSSNVNKTLSGHVGDSLTIKPSDYTPVGFSPDSARYHVYNPIIKPNGTLSPDIVAFYYKEGGSVTVNYVNSNGNDTLATKVFNGNPGVTNSIASQFSVPAGYSLVHPSDGNKTYTITNSDQTINIPVQGKTESPALTVVVHEKDHNGKEFNSYKFNKTLADQQVGNTVSVNPSDYTPKGFTAVNDRTEQVDVLPNNELKPTVVNLYYQENPLNDTVDYVEGGDVIKSYSLNNENYGIRYPYVSNDKSKSDYDPIPEGYQLVHPSDANKTYTASDQQPITIEVKGAQVSPTLTVDRKYYKTNPSGQKTLVSSDRLTPMIKGHQVGDRIRLDPKNYMPKNPKPGRLPIYVMDNNDKPVYATIQSDGKTLGDLKNNTVTYDYDETGPVYVNYMNENNNKMMYSDNTVNSHPYYDNYGATVHAYNVLPVPNGYKIDGMAYTTTNNKPQKLVVDVMPKDARSSYTVNIQVKDPNGNVDPSLSNSIERTVDASVDSTLTITPNTYRPSDDSIDTADKPVTITMKYNNNNSDGYWTPNVINFIYDEKANSNASQPTAPNNSSQPTIPSNSSTPSTPSIAPTKPNSGSVKSNSSTTPTGQPTMPSDSGQPVNPHTNTNGSSTSMPTGQPTAPSGSNNSNASTPSTASTPNSGSVKSNSNSTPTSQPTAPSNSSQPTTPSNSSIPSTPSTAPTKPSSGSAKSNSSAMPTGQPTVPSNSSQPTTPSNSTSSTNSEISINFVYRDTANGATELNFPGKGKSGSSIDYALLEKIGHQDLGNGYTYSEASGDPSTFQTDENGKNEYIDITPVSNSANQPTTPSNNSNTSTPSTAPNNSNQSTIPNTNTHGSSTNQPTGQPTAPSNSSQPTAPSNRSTPSTPSTAPTKPKSDSAKASGQSTTPNNSGQSTIPNTNTHGSSTNQPTVPSNSSQPTAPSNRSTPNTPSTIPMKPNSGSAKSNSNSTPTGQPTAPSNSSQPTVPSNRSVPSTPSTAPTTPSSSVNPQPISHTVTAHIIFKNISNGQIIQTVSDTGNQGDPIKYQNYIDSFKASHQLPNGDKYQINASNTTASLQPNTNEVIGVTVLTPSSKQNSNPNDKPVTAYFIFKQGNHPMQITSQTGAAGELIDYQSLLQSFNANHHLNNGYYVESLANNDDSTLQPNHYETINVKEVKNSVPKPASDVTSYLIFKDAHSGKIEQIVSDTGKSGSPIDYDNYIASFNASHAKAGYHYVDTLPSNAPAGLKANQTVNINVQAVANGTKSTPNTNFVTAHIIFTYGNKPVEIDSDTGIAGNPIDYKAYIKSFNTNPKNQLRSGYYYTEDLSKATATLQPNGIEVIDVHINKANSGSQSSVGQPTTPTSAAQQPTMPINVPTGQPTAPVSNPTTPTNVPTGQTTTPASNPSTSSGTQMPANRSTSSTVQHSNSVASGATQGPVNSPSQHQTSNQPSDNTSDNDVPSDSSNPSTNEGVPSHRGSDPVNSSRLGDSPELGSINNGSDPYEANDGSADPAERRRLPQTGEKGNDAKDIGAIMVSLALILGALDATVDRRRRHDE